MLKKLLIIGLYVVCIVSCTQETIIYNPVDNDKDTYTEGLVTVYLDGMGTVTRSSWEYDDYFSSSDILHDDCKHERGFYNRLLVSFDSNLLLEYYTMPNSGVNDSFTPPAIDNLTNPNNTAKEYTAVTLGLNAQTPLTTGAHYFYVLCNLPENMHGNIRDRLSQSRGQLTKDEFEQTVLEYKLDELAKKFEGQNAHNSQRCMMTNIASPTPDYMASKAQDFQGVGYPSTNNVKAHIGKIFAKASLAYVEENPKLSDVTYRVVNVPNSVYLLPNIFDKQVETPHFNDTDFEDEESYEANYSQWFDEKYKLYTNDPDWQHAVLSTSQEKTSVYCMENGNKTPLQGNSTFLLVKATYRPAEWVNKDGTSGSESGDNSFWRIKRAGIYTSHYYNEEPDQCVVGSGTIVAYPQGITYYPIWLQTDGIYQVRRNGFYKIVLTEVLSAGAPTLDSVIDPVAPIKTETRAGGNNAPELTNGIRWIQGNI